MNKKTVSLISILVAVSMMLAIFAGCNKENNTENTNTSNTSIPQLSYESIELPDNDEESSNSSMGEDENNNSTINFEFIEYKEEYKNFWELRGSSLGARTISVPSRTPATTNNIEEFYTANEFKSYLTEYSNIVNLRIDELTVERNHFIFNSPCGNFNIKTSDEGINRYFLLSSPSFSATKELDIDCVTIDKETDTAYIILEAEDVSYSSRVYAMHAADKIEAESETSYALCCVNISAECMSEVNHVYFVLPK